MTLPLQIKSDSALRVPGEAAPFTLRASGTTTNVFVEGRVIPIKALPSAPVERVAQAVARVPAALRSVLTLITISPEPSRHDAYWSKVYELPVHAGMGAIADGSGSVVIYPRGIEQLEVADKDMFVRGLMHELGHCWSLRAFLDTPSARERWLEAMASDPNGPSFYAVESFRKSGSPNEDVAEATALYFLVKGSPAFTERRTMMPSRFALLDERFDAA